MDHALTHGERSAARVPPDIEAPGPEGEAARARDRPGAPTI